MKQTKQEQGFTLIELIMVIVIMGILSAVVVPKFFSLEVKTHQKVEEAVIGNIKAGLLTYMVNELAEGGRKDFPDHASFTSLGTILDEVPDGWSIASGSANATITYDGRGDSTVTWDYTRSGDKNARSYTIDNRSTSTKP